MRRISWCLVPLACAVAGAARADLPNTAPIYGGDSLESVGAALEHSVSGPRHDDPREEAAHDEAERRLRNEGDALSLAMGSTATSVGATMMIGGIGLASTAGSAGVDCPACLPSIILIAGGLQLTVLGLFGLADYGGAHRGRHHERRVNALVRAMSHASIEQASAARRGRLTLGWTLLASGAVLVGSGVALFAMGHQIGLDDGVREALAAANAFVGGWLVTAGSGTVATKWTNELALSPTRGGAMVTYERRW